MHAAITEAAFTGLNWVRPITLQVRYMITMLQDNPKPKCEYPGSYFNGLVSNGGWTRKGGAPGAAPAAICLRRADHELPAADRGSTPEDGPGDGCAEGCRECRHAACIQSTARISGAALDFRKAGQLPDRCVSDRIQPHPLLIMPGIRQTAGCTQKWRSDVKRTMSGRCGMLIRNICRAPARNTLKHYTPAVRAHKMQAPWPTLDASIAR